MGPAREADLADLDRRDGRPGRVGRVFSGPEHVPGSSLLAEAVGEHPWPFQDSVPDVDLPEQEIHVIDRDRQPRQGSQGVRCGVASCVPERFHHIPVDGIECGEPVVGIGQRKAVHRHVQVGETLEHRGLDPGERDSPVDIFIGEVVDHPGQYGRGEDGLEHYDDKGPE